MLGSPCNTIPITTTKSYCLCKQLRYALPILYLKHHSRIRDPFLTPVARSLRFGRGQRYSQQPLTPRPNVFPLLKRQNALPGEDAVVIAHQQPGQLCTANVDPLAIIALSLCGVLKLICNKPSAAIQTTTKA